MMRVRFTMMGMAALLAGCASTSPAPVVQGKIQQSWQQARAAGTATRPMAAATTEDAAPATVQMAQSGTGLTVAPVVAEEELHTVQPAAGPATKPNILAAIPARSFTTVQVDRPVAATTTPAVTNTAATTHTVEPTDTLFKIARTYNTSADAIIRANGLKGAADIEAGRTLTIPAPSRAGTPSLVESISNYLRTPPPPAVAAAPEVAAAPVSEAVPSATTPVETAAVAKPAQFDVARIEPAAGETPRREPRKQATMVHTVKAGETIYRISKQYNVSVLDVMAANDLERPEALQAGMRLNIPQNNAAAPVATAPAKAEPVTAGGLRPAADLGVTETTRATITASQSFITAERPLNDPDKGTDTADTVRPLQAAEPITEKDKLRAELKRGQIDRAAAAQKGLIWPAKGNLVKRFGEKGNGVAHTGINIAVPANTPVLATEGGTVLYADGGLRTYGNMVLLRHSNGMVSAYAHLNHLLVRKGERVQKGQVLAMSGQTGNVESPQLHFELRRNATAIDPVTVLPN